MTNSTEFWRQIDSRINEKLSKFLQPTGVTPGVYSSVTVDRYGLVRFGEAGGTTTPSSVFLRQISFSVTSGSWQRVLWRNSGAVVTGSNLSKITSGSDVLSILPASLSGVTATIYAIHAGFVWAAASGWRHLAIMGDDGDSPPSKSIKAVTSYNSDGSNLVAQNVSCLIYHTSAIRYSVWVYADTDTSLSTSSVADSESGETFFHMYHLGTVP